VDRAGRRRVRLDQQPRRGQLLVLGPPDDEILYDQRIEVLVTDGIDEVAVSWLLEAP
jgi:hypothetical protein